MSLQSAAEKTKKKGASVLNTVLQVLQAQLLQKSKGIKTIKKETGRNSIHVEKPEM